MKEKSKIQNKETSVKTWQVLVFIGIIAIFGLWLYLSTVSSNVEFGDSGESVACAVISGVAHPPGYPAYTLTSRLFTFIPFGTTVFQVNLVSVISAVLVLIFLGLGALRIIPSIYGMALAVLMLAVSPTFWEYGTYAKCYAFGLLIIALMIFISFGFPSDKNPARISAVAFLFGLGLANHYQTILLFFPAVLFFLSSSTLKDKKIFPLFMASFVLFGMFTLSHGIKPLKIFFAVALAGFYFYYLYRALRETSPKFIPVHIISFLLGLLPYLYIPWAAGRDPLINWDQANTLRGFFDLVNIADFRSTFAPSLTAAASQLELYFTLLYRQFGPLGLTLAAAGAVWLYIKKRQVGQFLAIFWLFQVGGFALHLKTPMDELTPFVMEGFYLPAHLAITLAIAAGAGVLYELLKRAGKTRTAQIAACILPLLLFIVPINRAVQDFNRHDRSKFFFADDYAYNVFTTLPESAVLFSQADDGTFPLWYKQGVEKVRPDAIIIFSDLLPRPWYRAQLERRYNLKDPGPGKVLRDTSKVMADLIKSNPSRNFYMDYFNRTSYGKNIPVSQEGILFKVLAGGEKPGIDMERTVELLSGYKMRGVFDPAVYKNFFVLNLLPAYTKAYNDLGKAFAESGKRQEAVKYMEKALLIDPGNRVIKHNLEVLQKGGLMPAAPVEKLKDAGAVYRKGLAALKDGDPDDALSLWKEAVRLAPANPAYHNDLGNLLSRMGRLEDAEKHYRLSLSLSPRSPYVHYNIGRLYERMGEKDKAAEEYREELRVNPDFEEAKKALKRLSD